MSTYAGRVFVVAGPPAAGKGTTCKRLAEKYGLVHISIGDLFRDHIERGTDLGKRAEAFTSAGNFVPDDMLLTVVREKLSHPDVQTSGCLLDGVPRTGSQAQALPGLGFNIDRLLLLEVPDDTCVERALGRYMDPVSGAIYHMRFRPPPEEAAGRLVRRDNDVDEQTVRTRLGVYRSEIGKILPVFKGKVWKIDGTKGIDEVSAAVESSINAVGPPPGADEDDDWEDEEMPVQAVEDLGLAVAPSQDVPEGGIASVPVCVSVEVPESAIRVPTDVCCVVDISGSMRSPATYETDGVARDDGLTILDIVKHAVKTVMHMLKADDRVALVAFDDVAETALELTFMTESGRTQAVAALDSLQPRGRTNIWGGILAGMEALRATGSGPARQKALLLLTDGQPNISPPRGHVRELQDYMESHPGFKFQMNTFGFGYDLSSEILLDLAVEGNGTYAFIPDAVIVGTVFVNSVANVLSTRTQEATLHLTTRGGAAFAGPVLGNFKVDEASWGRVINLGPLQVGQSRQVVVPLSIPAGGESYLEVVVTYPPLGGGECKASTQASSRESTALAATAAARAQVVSVGFQAVIDASSGKGGTAGTAVKNLAAGFDALQGGKHGSDGMLGALRTDVDGRMSKALKGKERFNRWGKHYLRALMRAHQIQLCTNFMDPGLQLYGGELFRTIRSEGDDIFLSLPLPRPTGPTQASRPSVGTYVPPAATPNPPPRPAPAAAAAPAPAPASAPAPAASTYYAGGGGG